jgi:hypothetical protein
MDVPAAGARAQREAAVEVLDGLSIDPGRHIGRWWSGAGGDAVRARVRVRSRSREDGPLLTGARVVYTKSIAADTKARASPPITILTVEQR